MGLGRVIPYRTPNVEFIVSRGEVSIPLLVEALSSDNLVKVCYAAYCLELMQAQEGKATAQRTLKRVHALTAPSAYKPSAINALEDYLETLESR